jgi:hypothetical protein
MQLERAFALMAHYNNVLTDMVANDMYLATARLPESVKLLLQHIDFRMLPASPARTELLGELARTYAAPVRLLEANRKFATERTQDDPEIVFENAEALDTTLRTEQVSNFFGMEHSKVGVCQVLSVEPDIIEWVSGNTWVTADRNSVIEVTGSSLGNFIEDARIIELLDETTPGSGVWTKARLEGASFVTEGTLDWLMREPTSNGAATLVLGNPFDPYNAPEPGDKIYFGMADIMWDEFEATFDSLALGAVGVWEFYDPSDTSIQPDSITVDPSPGQLRFFLNGLMGLEDITGAHIRVMHVPTGYESRGISDYSGGNNYVDIEGYLGQATPSTLSGDYLVFCNWRPIDVTVDDSKVGAETWGQDGKTEFVLPQTASDYWQKSSIYDKNVGELRTGYYLRNRVITNPGSAAGPVPDSLLLTGGSQFILYDVTQGRSVEDDPLGSSSGEASQPFTLSRKPYVMNTVRIWVDEGGGDIEWSEVDSFLTSYSYDRHFVADVQTDGSAKIIFGDGTNGRIPPIGTNNIRALYRIGAEEDGNVGADQITVNRDGVGVFRSVTNPRAGQFWVEADWASVEALERVKRQGPFTLRTLYRAVTARDCEILAVGFLNTNGVRPVARAKAYEEAFGPKTVEIVVAGQGGAALDSDVRAELTEFFNGGDDYNGVLILNHEATITNYTPRQVAVEMEVTAYDVVTTEMVLQTLSFLLTPTAIESDGVSYVWKFGQEVPLSRIISEIFKISPGNVFKVDITSPSDDISLAANELPVFDSINSNVVMLEPSF